MPETPAKTSRDPEGSVPGLVLSSREFSDRILGGLPVGKEFACIGFGGEWLVDEAARQGWNLWSVTGEREGRDEFTQGWSGCDPCQIYFRENDQGHRSGATTLNPIEL